MPGGSLFGALPVGLILFAGTALLLLQRKWSRKQAARHFPELARELGLDYTPPRYAGAVGTLSGTFQDRVVRIDPDDQQLLKVRFNGAPRVDLRSYEHAPRAPFDMVTVYSGDRAFDRFFRTRFAAAPIAEQIAGDGEPGLLVEPFVGRFARQIQAVTVTAEGVVCRFDFGKPPHIPVDALRELLPACVALADLVEPRAGGLTGGTAG